MYATCFTSHRQFQVLEWKVTVLECHSIDRLSFLATQPTYVPVYNVTSPRLPIQTTCITDRIPPADGVFLTPRCVG